VRRLVTAAVLLGACFAAVVLSGAAEESKKNPKYQIVFDNAFGLVEGGDFRVGGVRAGKTSKFEVKTVKGHAPKAVVTAEINQPGFGDIRSDARCTIRPQSLIGEYYVDCQPGTRGKRLPTDGKGVLPVERTESTVPTDLVNNILRRPYRERLRLIITELGTGLAGRPEDLQDVLRRAHPGLRETTRVLRILGDQNEVIENFIRDSDTVVEELEANKRDVSRWVTETGRAAEISATRREDIRRSFRRLPVFLSELRPTMRRLGELADEQTPLLADLQRAAPDFNTFLRRLGPFSRASRPALRSLGRASLQGTRAFRAGKEEIRELETLARDAAPTAKPLRQYLESLDDRRRALEHDVRAKNSAPPSPDPTAIPGTGGFTGLEAIWNYFFWQTLSVNLVDENGHMLRTGLTANDCSPFRNIGPRNAQEQAFFDRCTNWLGPYQPGVTAPDPTEPGSRARALLNERRASKAAGPADEQRGPGQPEAPPEPGQRDISKPRTVLPPAVQELLDRLAPGKLDRVPSPEELRKAPLSEQDTGQLLDYLLAP
jgi:ABC-type transporter Mla subunit MlaD